MNASCMFSCWCSLPVFKLCTFCFLDLLNKIIEKAHNAHTVPKVFTNFSIKRVFKHFTMNLCSFVVLSTHHTCIHERIYWVLKMLNAENYNINVENDVKHDRVLWGITLCKEILWKRKIGQKQIIFCGCFDFLFKVMAFPSHLNRNSFFLFSFSFSFFYFLFAAITIHTSEGVINCVNGNKQEHLFILWCEFESEYTINCECERLVNALTVVNITVCFVWFMFSGQILVFDS